MNRLEIAVRTFFWIFFNKRFAEKVGSFFGEEPIVEKEVAKEPRIAPVQPPKVTHNEAVQLIAALQREGRLVDFLMEPIEAYSDAQIGAAVRDVHRDCGSVLHRVFAPVPIASNDEGSSISVLPGFDPSQYRLSGNVTGKPPFNGVVRHKGWRASHVELPQWQGSAEAATVIAPVEVELP